MKLPVSGADSPGPPARRWCILPFSIFCAATKTSSENDVIDNSSEKYTVKSKKIKLSCNIPNPTVLSSVGLSTD